MTHRTYLLVFREDILNDNRALKVFADGQNEGGTLFRFDHNIAFLQTTQDVETLTARLRNDVLGDNLFFADISKTARADNMVPDFWNILHNKDTLIAAS